MKIVFLLALAFSSLAAQCRGREEATSVHGTLITALANQQSVVVVADSMGSQAGGAIRLWEPVQKLLRYDDRTVCATAGLLLQKVQGNSRLAPLYTLQILGVVNEYGNAAKATGKSQPMNEVLEGLSASLQYYLGLYADLDGSLGHPTANFAQAYSMDLLLAGYDLDGKAKIGHLKLSIAPVAFPGGQLHWSAVELVRELHVSEDKLLIIPIGITSIENGMLAHPDRYADVRIMNEYAESMNKNKGVSFSREQMKKLGQLFKDRTQNEYPQVGNKDQIAIIQRGKEPELDLPTLPQIDRPQRFAVMMCGPGGNLDGGELNGPGLVFEYCPIIRATVHLDGLVLLHCTFMYSTITYDGGDFILGEGNQFLNSTLVLGPHSSNRADLVSKLQSKFDKEHGGTASWPSQLPRPSP